MQLPADKVDDEQVVSVPKLLKAAVRLTLALVHRVVDHNAERGGHDPARRAWTRGEVGLEEDDK